MRTTGDLEVDTLLAAKEIARQALARPEANTTRNGIPLFPIRPGAQVITPELVNQLRDELLCALS